MAYSVSVGRRAAIIAFVAVAAAIGVVGFLVRNDGSDDDAGVQVHGPLCAALPAGDDPGNPDALAELDASVALTWIPVLTIFEAGTRASGLTTELADADGVTILAPSDDAFLLALSQETLDELIISRHDELRELLDAHIVDGAMTVEDLVDAGSVTTRSGNTVVIEAAGDEARLDGRAATVCSDYRVANATIHVVDGVLGELPAPAEPAGPAHG